MMSIWKYSMATLTALYTWPLLFSITMFTIPAAFSVVLLINLMDISSFFFLEQKDESEGGKKNKNKNKNAFRESEKLEELEELENRVLRAKGCQFRHVYHTFEVEHSSPSYSHPSFPQIPKKSKSVINLHSLVSTQSPRPSNTSNTLNTSNISTTKPTILFVHGTAGSALGILASVFPLNEKYDIHCIDLPGFGRSTIWEDGGESVEICEFYTRCIRVYIEEQIGMTSKVILVGHSFGGFLCCAFVQRYPEMIDRLILVDSVGLFPLLGEWGSYWAVFFKMNLPHLVFRMFDRLGFKETCVSLITRIFSFSDPNFVRHNVLLLSSTKAGGDKLIGRFIHVGPIWSYWKDHCFLEMMDTKIPLGFIYGELDTMIPYHQGIAFSRAAATYKQKEEEEKERSNQYLDTIPVNIVRGAGHSPYSDDPVAFNDALESCIIHARPPRSVKDDGILHLRGKLSFYRSSFCRNVTRDCIKRQYADVIRGNEGCEIFEGKKEKEKKKRN